MSHAMLTKTLRPDGRLMVAGEAAAWLGGPRREEGEEVTELRAVDLMQKAAVGERETLVVADMVAGGGGRRRRARLDSTRWRLVAVPFFVAAEKIKDTFESEYLAVGLCSPQSRSCPTFT